MINIYNGKNTVWGFAIFNRSVKQLNPWFIEFHLSIWRLVIRKNTGC